MNKSYNDIQDWLINQISEYTFTDPSEINTDVEFNNFGISSRDAILLSGDLEEWLGRRLSPTLIYEYPTIRRLSLFLANDDALDEKDGDSISANLINVNKTKPVVDGLPLDISGDQDTREDVDSVAIVGMGFRFPGGETQQDFWKLLINGRDAVKSPPEERRDLWNNPEDYQFHYKGGYLYDIDKFDAQFFNISPREAEWMDPQQRILAEVVFEAFQDAGLVAEDYRGTDAGVFIGISGSDYSRLPSNQYDLLDAYGGTGSALSIAANRISYIFDLHGPSISIDTACSSSLVGIHLACQSLEKEECDLAIVGGVNLIISPELNIIFSKAQMLSPDAACKTFDESANGYVRGEGCGVVILKKLSKAKVDGDQVYALIRGTAVNQDGQTNGLTAPSVNGQQKVIEKALQKAKVQPELVSYIEAHGTGTYLGDQIEAKALGVVYSKNRPYDYPLYIGSVKTNIGHLEAASGIASLIKVVLMMKYQQIPPSLHFTNPNPNIDFNGLSLVVPTSPIVWGQGKSSSKLFAGVNSFGFGGTNAHIILESYQERTQHSSGKDENRYAYELNNQVIPFSAKSYDSLFSYLDNFNKYLFTAAEGKVIPSDENEPTLFEKIVHTLQVQRDHFPFRFSFTAADLPDLHRKISAFLETENFPVVVKQSARKIAAEKPNVKFNFPSVPEIDQELMEKLSLDVHGFGNEFKALNEISRKALGWDLGSAPSQLKKTNGFKNVQLFIAHVCLAKLWRSWGLDPVEYSGEGVGHLSAQVLKDELNIEEGLLRSFETNYENGNVESPQQQINAFDGEITLEILLLNESTLLDGLSDLFQYGVDINWTNPTLDFRNRIDLPKYSWERKHYWLNLTFKENKSSKDNRDPGERDERKTNFTGRRIYTPLDEVIYEYIFSGSKDLILKDNINDDNFKLQDSFIQDLVLESGRQFFDTRLIEIDTFENYGFILFGKHNEILIQTIITPNDNHSFNFKLHRQEPGDRNKWQLFAKGTASYFKELTSSEDILTIQPGVRKKLILHTLRKEVAESLRYEYEDIDVQVPVIFLGMDSIVAVEIINKVEQIFGYRLSISHLLQGQTLDDLSELITNEINLTSFNRQVNFPTVNVTTNHQAGAGIEFQLSPGQKAMWLQHQVNPASVFNPAQAFKIRSSFNIQQFRNGFDILVQRHPALRTTFHQRDGLPVQIIHQEANYEFTSLSCFEWTNQQVDEYLFDCAYAEFDLENGPLLRVYVLELVDSHILLISAHHLVVDLWSFAVLVFELYKLLEEENGEGELVNLQYNYSDYVNWQTNFLNGPDGDRLWEYWKVRLRDAVPVLDLPTDYPRKPIQTYNGANQTIILDGNLAKNLEKLAEKYGLTMFMLLVASFKVLLFRYTSQEDIILGTPTTGRTKNEFSNLVGYFVNPVPLRSRMNTTMRFSEYLNLVRDMVVGALENQDYPFPMLVERLHPERDASILPLFQVMFAYQRSHLLYEEGLSKFSMGIEGLKMSLAHLELESVDLHQKFSQFDLILTMANVDGGLGATITYNTDLFEAETATRLLHHLKTILEGAITSPDTPIGQLPMLTSEEYDRLVIQWNQTYNSTQLDEPVHKLFERQVERTPGKDAIRYEGITVTYDELNRKANKLAHYLKRNGVGTDKIIGVFMEKSPDLIVAILGILKAGGAYVPLDPVHPYERIAFMLQDARVPIVLTQSNMMSRIPTLIAKPLFIDSHWGLIAQEGEENLDQQGSINDLAYIIYTSGSTGRSKGVLIEHQGLTNLILHDIQGFQVSDSSNFLQFASIGFDASVLEIFTTLLSGATLVMAKREILLSVPDLYNLLDREKITTALLPPSLLALLPSDGLPDFKMVLSGGESCTLEISEKWSKGRTFINAYGPTETTVAPTYYIVDSKTKYHSSIPIGKPISNTQIFILDSMLQPVPVGVRGELYIGGIGIARGYLNRSELTEEKFVSNPFLEDLKPHSKWVSKKLYKTGDLGRFLPDGNIEFIGRIDHQVKLRGFRIELGEIETTIDLFPGVNQVVVVVREDNPGEKRLVAYIVQEAGVSIRINELRRYLREKMPEYMIPAAFVILDELKLNASGKVDRKTLPIPTSEQSDSGTIFVSPKTDLEKTIAQIWEEVLNVNRIGLNDNFFDLGGHSLLMATAHSRLQEALNREFSLISLFQYPTISSLVDFLSGESDELSNIELVTDRAIHQKSAMKRQSDRMRQIARNRIKNY